MIMFNFFIIDKFFAQVSLQGLQGWVNYLGHFQCPLAGKPTPRSAVKPNTILY